MGKKSVVDTPLLPSAQAADAPDPAAQSAPGELFQEFLRVALRAQLDTWESRSKNQVRFRPLHTWTGWKGRSWSCWTLVSGGRFADEDFRKLHSTQKMMKHHRIKTVRSGRLGSAWFHSVRQSLQSPGHDCNFLPCLAYNSCATGHLCTEFCLMTSVMLFIWN